MIRFKLNPSRPAYSLAFAIVYMTIILIVASSTMENVREKIVYYRDMEGPAQARLYAEGAVDLAKAYVMRNGFGYEEASADCTPDIDEETDQDELRCGAYNILALARENPNGGSGFYIPIPHTGSAAPEDACSVREFLDGEAQPPSHACNWNKMRFGESVSIPLFIDIPAEDGGGTLNPSELGMTQLTMTFRTPCKPDPATGAARLECAAGDRYELDEGNGISIDQNNSLVLWQLYGQLTDGTEVSLLVDDEVDPFSEERDLFFNTEITESRVNDGTSIVSTVGGTDAFDVIADFLNNPDLDFAFLQMDAIYPLIQDVSGDPIPYLEWQFSSNTTFPDIKATLFGNGYYEAASGIFSYPLEIQVPVTGEGSTLYTVSN